MLCPNVTFVVFTYNEQQRITRVLQNFAGIGPILVVDNDSTDQTADIARSFGATVLLNKNQGWVEDEVTAARVKEAVQTDWIYWGFADEMIDHETAGAIAAAVDSNDYDIVNITRKNYYYGKFCHDAFADRMNRIFRKAAIDFNGNVIHGFGKVTVPESRIKMLDDRYFVHHFISNVAKSYILTMDRYTDVQASPSLYRSPLRLVLASLKMALTQYVLRGGYKAGPAGAFLTANCAFYGWMLSMKAYEKAHGVDRPSIEASNDTVRDHVLQSFKAK
ncbi:glycosyltransferase [Pigmentiphaga litoralis]|uniref:Glycosyltransferase involved in cell wall biosynthesis n=1 Tax=Pigmentiphaga litoralis TaxID=516702 RepID=A0A7Y9ISH5_9BURK|nr:glycosyltransferase involved in cell wall biosynthesis [Pigmentiphaga litoralis]NYE82162.1 glycosyltransferase involved in cell wall biosynthesis [Pigmentiphaga litoralis]